MWKAGELVVVGGLERMGEGMPLMAKSRVPAAGRAENGCAGSRAGNALRSDAVAKLQ